MKKNLIKIATFLAVTLVPQITFAATQPKNLLDLAGIVIKYLNVGIILIISLAVVTFIWNVYRYFFTEKDKKEAGMYVLYSVIGFFVILTFWGLVAIITGSLNLPNNQPAFPFGASIGGTNGGGTNNGASSIFNSNGGTAFPASSGNSAPGSYDSGITPDSYHDATPSASNNSTEGISTFDGSLYTGDPGGN